MFYMLILQVIPVEMFIRFVYFPSLNIMKICFFQSLKAAMSSHKVADQDEPTLEAVKVAAETPVPTTRGETSTSTDVHNVASTVDPPDGPSCSQPTEAAMSSHKVADPDEPTLEVVKVAAETLVPTTRGETSTSSDVRDVASTVDPPDGPSCSQPTEAAENTDEQPTENAQEDQVECNSCILLEQKNRILTLRGHLKKRKVEKRKFARKGE